MKYLLILLFLIGQDFHTYSQDNKFLKGVNNIFVQVFINGESIKKYLSEDELKRIVELELIDNEIRVTDDNKNSKFILTIIIYNNLIGNDIAFSLNFDLSERVYLSRVKTNVLTDIYTQIALAGAPDNREAKEYFNVVLNDFLKNFMYKYKKDNQK